MKGGTFSFFFLLLWVPLDSCPRDTGVHRHVPSCQQFFKKKNKQQTQACLLVPLSGKPKSKQKKRGGKWDTSFKGQK